MRRSMWIRILAVILVITMLSAPVSAATVSVNVTEISCSDLIGTIIGIIREIWDRWHDDPTVPTDPPATTEPEATEPEATEPEVTEPEESVNYELELIEGHANTENGYLLRAVTYSLAERIANEAEPQTAPYALRTTTMETGIATRNLNSGISTMATETTVSDTALTITTDDTGVVIANGDYAIYSSVNGKYMTNTVANSDWGTQALQGTTDATAATVWTITRQTNGTYTIVDPNGQYLDVSDHESAGVSSTATYYTAEKTSDTTITLQKQNAANAYSFLNALGNSTGYNFFGGWSDGSNITLYAVTTTETEEPEDSTQTGTTNLIYFPVTMFNYDGATINAATDALDPNGTTVREGFYFSNGGDELGEVTYNTTADLSAYVDGNYYIQNLRAKDYNVASWLYYNASAGSNRYINSTTQDAAQVWTLTNKGNNQVTLSYVQNNTTYYMTIGDGTSGVTTTETLLTLEPYTGTNKGIQIKGTEYLCQFGGTNVAVYGGYEQSNDSGNGMAFFAVSDDGTVASESLEVNIINSEMISGYERWNWWGYLSPEHAAQNQFWGGLVEDQLDADNDIVFTVNEGGVFTLDSAVKDIYTNVGLPFVLNDKGYYTFDSDAHGTYFSDTDGDGASNPASGTEEEYYNMYFDPNNTQGWDGMNYGDGSTNLWAPFNTNSNDTSANNIDYHLGMRADIPFSMTPNGCIKSTDDNSEHITFTFAGDDDVWIFIDGHLVIDLGGIHNRIGATIDFADNTITYFRPESNNQTLPIGSYNNPDQYPLNEDGTITVPLYNSGTVEGALGQTRVDFASDEEHVMSIFYLERGKGTSNCKIEFNLPMRDTVLITKDATKSWSEEQDAAYGDKGDGTVSLTAKEQAAVDKLNFGFTLYKKTADEDTFTAVKNTNFYVQNSDGKVLSIQSTDSNGKFYLKNGQTAKFMTDIPKDGVTYYVVEDAVPEGFLTPDFNFGGTATYGMTYAQTEDGEKISVANGSLIPEQELALNATENKSYLIEVKGSFESIDSVEFICTNYLDAELPNPTALAYEDIIVIDYGLPVHIDPLDNDLFRGDDIEIVAWGDKSLTLDEALDDYGNAIEAQTSWEGTQVFHSGTVKFNDRDYPKGADVVTSDQRDTFEYTLTKQLTEVEVISYIVKVNSTLDVMVDGEPTGQKKEACRYALARVYIVPATIMYYEENFSDMILFEGAWDADSTVVNQGNVSAFQEPGVVGTLDDSTYGSDVAYLSDNGDSNGTYRYGDTTNKAIRFTYTFTGTGTSIFARTSAKTGYMQVKVYEGTDTRGSYLNVYYRDTYYEDTNDYGQDATGTLYNIPVFTESDLDYGTYTVVCTVAKKGTLNAGPVVEETDANGNKIWVKRSGNEFYLDGIRVMQPLNEKSKADLVEKALGAYNTDGEANLDVVTLREKLINDVIDGTAQWNGTNFVMLTDTIGNIVTADDYVSFGPKEEVYLAPYQPVGEEANIGISGQKVTFSLKYWQPEGLKLYMGMKAPFGYAKVTVGDKSYELYNAPDCYYDVTDYASLQIMYEQAMNENGDLLFTDPSGNEVYMDADGKYFYTSNNAPVPANMVLTPKDDTTQPYYVATYSFEATESVVALTNIKVVGSHEFIIIEDGGDTTVDGSEGSGDDTNPPIEEEEEITG